MIMILVIVVIFNETATDYLANIFYQKKAIISLEDNEFKKNDDFLYVKNSDDFTPYSYGDIINIIYTVLNSGNDNFTFYCPNEYTNCLDDVKDITQNNTILTDINNYTHPFNNFINMQTTIASSGEVNIQITHIYSDDEISQIKAKVQEIENDIYTSDMEIMERLKAAHDYIITHSLYDTDRKDNNSEKYKSNIAYGPLFEGYAICSGYADAMAIFIANLNIKNYKVASETHVWNAVYINDTWMHIDATWDNQIDTNGHAMLIHKFFLINTENLQKYAQSDHNFNQAVYREFLYN